MNMMKVRKLPFQNKVVAEKIKIWSFYDSMCLRSSFLLLSWLIKQANVIVLSSKSELFFFLNDPRKHKDLKESLAKHSTNYRSNSATFARYSLVTLATSNLHVQFSTIPANSDILENSNFAPLATSITQNLRPKSKF